MDDIRRMPLTLRHADPSACHHARDRGQVAQAAAKTKPIHGRGRSAWAGMLLLIWLVWAPALHAGAHTRVGEITLSLGEAWVVDDKGERREVRAQGAVHEGEAIETSASGHVHVRLVDGGLISVRPNSRLRIAEYGDPARGGAVRLQLEHGRARSITGRYGESDRSRFRLNTPIVAIGINGTDFLVDSNREVTQVAVFSGSIIAAPLDDACRPEGLGPCHTERARRLSADMGPWLLEIMPHKRTPRLLPRGEDFAQAPAKPVSPAAAELAVDLVKGSTPPLPSPADPAALVWGRWAHAPAWPEDRLPEAGQVAAGRERVAENARYVLYRLPQNEPTPTQGRVQLGLAAAQAHLVQPQGVVPAAVREGRLDIDFAARVFATALTLDSAPTGRVSFAAAGALGPDGAFARTEFYTRIQGAYTTGGGPAAAYLFEHATPQGMFMGLTEWR